MFGLSPTASLIVGLLIAGAIMVGIFVVLPALVKKDRPRRSLFQRATLTFTTWMVVVAVSVSACSGLIDELPTTPDPVITTDTFSGTLTVNGGATHQFFTVATGTVTATLTSLGENPPSRVGFSMGTMAGSTCTIVLRNDNAVVTTVLTGSVSTLQGALCVSIYDTGAMSGPLDYTFTVSHP